MSKEQLRVSPEQHNQNPEALREEAELAKERLQENLERRAERSPETSVEDARHEALERAKDHEAERNQVEREANNPEREQVRLNTKDARKASYDHTMKEVQSHMSPVSRTFSKIIHQPVVEKISDGVGSTIARPNATLSGAVFAFLFTLAVYLIGRHFGYPLSGFETIGAFILGWIIGILYDFLKVMITGKKA